MDNRQAELTSILTNDCGYTVIRYKESFYVGIATLPTFEVPVLTIAGQEVTGFFVTELQRGVPLQIKDKLMASLDKTKNYSINLPGHGDWAVHSKI